MSFQTGRHLPTDRRPSFFERMLIDPNPVWIREMKQSARLTRTPFILMGITLFLVMIIGTIGGVMSTSSDPALIGTVIFHVFFSLAYFIVTMGGAIVAANSIASEREGRTWEAIQLTGLPPTILARGKFFATYTNVAMYIVMMAPVGAMTFLFGGITATETIFAFLWLFIFAGLSVATGLAISSKMESLRGAIIVTFFVSVVCFSFLYLVAGVGGSFAAGEIWPLVKGGPPVWLPLAYGRASFGFEYLALLLIGPLVAAALPAWFFYEVTITNLTNITEDRSSGLRRWFLVTSTLLTIGSAIAISVTPAHNRKGIALIAFCLYFIFLTFVVFIFQGEPVGLPRRVELEFDQKKVGSLRRMMGPGVIPAAKVTTITGLLGAMGLLGVTILGVSIGGRGQAEIFALALVGVYGIGFFLFVSGFGFWLRVRTNEPAISRILLTVALFFASVGPWVFAAIVGSISSGRRLGETLIAAPSPFYPIVVFDELRRSSSPEGILLVGSICAIAWAFLGLGLLGATSVRASKIIREHKKVIAESDAFLKAEDEGTPSANKATLLVNTYSCIYLR